MERRRCYQLRRARSVLCISWPLLGYRRLSESGSLGFRPTLSWCSLLCGFSVLRDLRSLQKTLPLSVYLIESFSNIFECLHRHHQCKGHGLNIKVSGKSKFTSGIKQLHYGDCCWHAAVQCKCILSFFKSSKISLERQSSRISASGVVEADRLSRRGLGEGSRQVYCWRHASELWVCWVVTTVDCTSLKTTILLF